MSILDIIFNTSPIHGAAGRERGYKNTLERIREGLTEEQAAALWLILDISHPDAYDQGAMAALTENGFPNPRIMP